MGARSKVLVLCHPERSEGSGQTGFFAALRMTREAQLLNYLKATGVKVGLLLNFGPRRVEVKRMVF